MENKPITNFADAKKLLDDITKEQLPYFNEKQLLSYQRLENLLQLLLV